MAVGVPQAVKKPTATPYVALSALWQEGEPRYFAEDVISGLTKFIPSLRGSFPISWSLVTAWQRNELPQRCVPIDLRTVKGYCGLAASFGDPNFALLLALGYHGILRTAEMFNIKVAVMEISKSQRRAVLTLPQSKSGTRYPTAQIP